MTRPFVKIAYRGRVAEFPKGDEAAPGLDALLMENAAFWLQLLCIHHGREPEDLIARLIVKDVNEVGIGRLESLRRDRAEGGL